MPGSGEADLARSSLAVLLRVGTHDAHLLAFGVEMLRPSPLAFDGPPRGPVLRGVLRDFFLVPRADCDITSGIAAH